MSRTDKDVPWRIAAEWYAPLHMYCQYDNFHVGFWPKVPRRQGRRPCDLPPAPRRGENHPSAWRNSWRRDEYHCTWEPEYPYGSYRWSYNRPPTKKERHLDWWGPDRAQRRDQCREAMKEYSGEGDIEATFVYGYHHRHASKKGWWN